jgi:hypothetical protein
MAAKVVITRENCRTSTKLMMVDNTKVTNYNRFLPLQPREKFCDVCEKMLSLQKIHSEQHQLR